MPDSDVHYACDWRWWDAYKGLPDYKGLKLCQDQNFSGVVWDIKKVIVKRAFDTLLVSEFGIIGWGGNSGFHAINLAVQFGCKQIILVGYDMTLANGVHWHGSHKGKLNDPNAANVVRWRNAIDDAHRTLNGLGVNVINCSMVSTLKNYEKMSLEEALKNVETDISGAGAEYHGGTSERAAEDLFVSG